MNRDSAELGQDSDNGEKTAGVSSFFKLGSKEENIFPRVVDVVALVLSFHGSLVVLAFLEKHWLSQTVKTIHEAQSVRYLSPSYHHPPLPPVFAPPRSPAHHSWAPEQNCLIPI